jgi:hypothetical protein
MEPIEQQQAIERNAHATTRAMRRRMHELRRARRLRLILGAIAARTIVVAFSRYGWAWHLGVAHRGSRRPAHRSSSAINTYERKMTLLWEGTRRAVPGPLPPGAAPSPAAFTRR